MRLTLLGSGSSGNSLVVDTGGTRVLVDAGVNLKTLRERWALVHGDTPFAVDAILLTHAHGDHVGHASSIASKLDVPVYLSESARRCVRLRGQVRSRVFGSKAAFDIGELHVEPFAVPHDAPQVALAFVAGGSRVALVTDLGEVPAGLAEHLARAELVLLESNHDPGMLERGPYAPSLKRRIGSRLGHLSNAQSAELVRALAPHTRRFVLMHLSDKNNLPSIALEHAREAIGAHAASVECAPRYEPAVLDTRVVKPVQTEFAFAAAGAA